MDHIVATVRFNLNFAKRLAADIPEDKMAVQPLPGMNHAAWILGHLSMPRLWMKDLLKLDVTVPPTWIEKFNMGTMPITDRAFYPSKAELIAAVEETYLALAAGLQHLTEADLAQENPNERMRPMMPTAGDLIISLVTSHQAFHQGQLSAWRRAMGMPSVMGNPPPAQNATR